MLPHDLSSLLQLGVQLQQAGCDMTVESFDNLFWFLLNYPGGLGGHPSAYRDIVFENIEANQVGTAFEAHASKEQPLRNVTLRNVHIASAKTPLVLENVSGMKFENVRIGNQTIEGNLSWSETAAAR
ncbi:hypothetical protein EAW52_20270 [Pseudomonas sp. LTJR-52]|uniref:hypothetical protein n=1 Tax=Pseudomonas sp. LTJR-52 TaxID=2479392 RepID=UPI000EFC6726|nr:hypothetical protein [Pseudomonas sp. LTJR-52]AYN96129.1 hypothetical protein EAW52_20270 [Pseudomonas sp. LTJR-52]